MKTYKTNGAPDAQPARRTADALRSERDGAVNGVNANLSMLQRYQRLAGEAPAAIQLRQYVQMMSASRSATATRAPQAPSSAHVKRIAAASPAHTNGTLPAASTPHLNGLPAQLISGIESLSGMDMAHVRVHFNSDKPAQLQAHAYAQGSEIHVGPGQEHHLPHEAWHVVQQAQGRVQPLLQTRSGMPVNDDPALEAEADVMGAMAQAHAHTPTLSQESSRTGTGAVRSAVSGRSILQAKFHKAPTETEPARHFDDFLGSYITDISVIEGYAPWQRFYQSAEEAWWIHMPETDYRPEVYVRREAADMPALYRQDMLAKKEYLDGLKGEEIAANAFLQTARIGLELTFNSEESKKYIGNSGFPVGKKSEATKWWMDELTKWTAGVEHLDYVYDSELDVEIETYHKQKDLGGGTAEMENWRVVYRDAETNVFWWWQLSMDPGVIEIQTAPATGANLWLGCISEIVETIFARASKRGFVPGGGGGHINVDFETGFGGDVALIPDILVATERLIANLDDAGKELVDISNELEDPFISTPRVKMITKGEGDWDPAHIPDDRKARNYLGEWERDVRKKRKVTNVQQLMLFRDAHAAWLHLHPTLSQQKGANEQSGKLSEKKNAHSLKLALHYQAVNIDHLFDKVIKEDSVVVDDPRRLEFRFFKAQSSIDEIIASIKMIGAIVKIARESN